MNDNIEQLQSLMHLAQTGDKKAYASLLVKCTYLLKGYLINKLSSIDEVDDVVQEILVSLHKARHTYDKSRPFKPWLFSIAKFRLYDYLRKIYKNSDNKTTYLNEVAVNSDLAVTKEAESYEELYIAIDKLPAKQAKIIKLMKIDGYTAKEVGIKLDMSESAVKVTAHRAYKTLKETIERN